MRVNALQIRNAFGAVLRQLARGGKPIVIEKNRQAVAVLISMADYEERFLDFLDIAKREELLALAGEAAEKSKENSVELLRELRYGDRR